MTIPDSVTEIGDYAFRGCAELKSISLPDTLGRIGVCTFQQSGLETADLPESAAIIDKYAFMGSRALREAAIPERVETVGKNAFYKCGALHSVITAEGDGERIKALIAGSRFDVSGLSVQER